jgi:hypothetical protein
MDGVIMLKRNPLYLLGALMFILWAGQPVQSQSTPEIPLKKKTCGDLWPVEKDKKWGYIDQTGRLIIPFKFDGADDFSEGLAAVEIKEKTGYIDKTGKFVIQPQFHRVGDFSEGLAAVVPVDASWPGNLAYINQSGQIVIKSMSTVPDRPDRVEFDLHYYRFCSGVARVSLGKNEDRDVEGYINKEGKFLSIRRNFWQTL